MAVRPGTIVWRLVFLMLILSVSAVCLRGMTLAEKIPGPAPDFSLQSLGGRTIESSGLRGRPTFILFGATWCPHCQTALDRLAGIQEALGDQANVLFVAVGQDAEQVLDFFGDDIPPYWILLDGDGEVSGKYGIKRIPICAFIDDGGLIRYMGRFNETIIRRLLSGERIKYPDRLRADLDACDRLEKRPESASPGKKRYIVELDEKPGLSRRLSKGAINAQRAHFRKAAERIGGRIIHNYGKLNKRIVVEMSAERAERLRDLPRFKRFKEDRRVRALLEDSVYQIRADYAWDNAITGQGVKVCVVDTGIDHTHPDLLNKVIAQYNSPEDSEDAMDDNGHGTHVAGIIASEGLQFRGVSHDVSLLAAKALDATGNGYSSDVILGVKWCVEQGADVINLSVGEGLFSGTCDDDEMAQAVNEAVDAGVVVVCAAGNDGDLTAMVSPACASKAIAVGAVDKLDNVASYSDGGPELDLVAPGGDQLGGQSFPEIVAPYSTEVALNPDYCMYLITEECWDKYFTVDGDRYIRAVGTSMATPHVAGAAALLLEENPSLTPLQVKTLLEQTADDLGAGGRDNAYGWGRINIEKAIDNIPAETGELTVTITEPNASAELMVSEEFGLGADIDCFGGDGCGEVQVYAEYCEGRDCNDFQTIGPATTISTLENNPNSLGILSGYSVDSNAPVVFDVETVLDISENAHGKSLNPEDSLVGATLPGEYGTGDLEPADGVGAVGEDVAVQYSFELPPGTIKNVKVRLENYMVIHWDYPPFAGWYVYTSNAGGDNLHLVGDCIPPEGGGGETPPPDCWFISDDPNVLGDLNAGGANYIKLASHDVGSDGYGQDWLTFNDIEVIVEYEPDPDNDEVYKYYVKFDITMSSSISAVSTARTKLRLPVLSWTSLRRPRRRRPSSILWTIRRLRAMRRCCSTRRRILAIRALLVR